MLVVTLLLSVFSFSGFAVYPSQQKQIEKIELVVAIKQTSKAHSFQYAVVASHENKFLFQLDSTQLNKRIQVYALSIKIKLNDASLSVDSFERPTEFLRLTSNSRHSIENHFNPLRG